MTLTTLALAVLLSAIQPVENGLTCKNQQAGIERFIVSHLKQARFGSKRYRKALAKQLSMRIVFEAKRFSLDPLVMTTIAWIESDFRPNARGRYGGKGRRSNEIGVWQLIPWDAAVKKVARMNFGCKPTAYMNKWQKRRWRVRYRNKPCKHPDIGKLRLKSGYFSRAELKTTAIGTFVAAFEMRTHIDACKKRTPKAHKWWAPKWLAPWRKANPKVGVTNLERYLHYNWGSKQYPGNKYREKLFKRYVKVRGGVCSQKRV